MIKYFTFIHYGDKRITKDNFKKPNLAEHRLLNIPNDCLFLSRETEDKSFWYNHCIEKTEMIKDAIKKGINIGETSDYEYWINGDKFKYKLNGGKILLVHQKNITKIFKKFGMFHKETSHIRNQKKIEQYVEEIQLLLDYVETFKYKYDESDKEKITKIIKLSPKKVPYKINKKKKDFKNWCLIWARISYLYNKMREAKEYISKYIEWEFDYYELDYTKIKEAGYDGIYFPQELIKEKKRFCGKDLYIRRTLSALGADSLIIWNWCLDTID